MTATLHHAQPILAAAINAGFRESGVQSLKNLDDANTFPMVAVRSAGLGLESLVGYLDDDHEGNEDNKRSSIVSLVDEGYLELLVTLANERFVANRERVERFRDGLAKVRNEEMGWEDTDTRKERKKKEGLQMQRSSEAKRRFEESSPSRNSSQGDQDIEGILLGMNFE